MGNPPDEQTWDGCVNDVAPFQVSSAADCLAFMQGGCELKKIRPNSRVYCRFYTLDPDLSCLRWEPSKKDGERARLDVSSIREVRTGKSTETFLHNGLLSEQLAEEAAFSIIHGEDYQVPHPDPPSFVLHYF